MSAKNLFLIIFLGSFVLSAVVMVVAIQTYKDSQDYQGGFEFSSSMRGVNYEVFLPSKDDPAGFCVIEGRNDNMLIIALDYFYITQDDQSIYGVAVDNSRFEIQQELSGCWTIVRETNDLRVRLVNLSNSDIFFETKDTKLEEVYTERYEKVRSTLDTLVILTAVLFASLTTTALLTVFFPEEF